jgi:hypothetical protein
MAGQEMIMAKDSNTKPAGCLRTTWRTASYDVWGNEKDGYEVNDVYRGLDAVIYAPITRYNVGTAHEFRAAYPNDKQIREALGIRPRVRLDIEGDDLTIYVNRARDGYPIGELTCISHHSLSPVIKHE